MSNIKYYKSLAQDVMLDFSEQELAEIANSDEQLHAHFKKVLKIDTTNVKPIFYPYEDIHTYLRNDEEISVIQQSVILQNAPTISDDFVTIVKVVK